MIVNNDWRRHGQIWCPGALKSDIDKLSQSDVNKMLKSTVKYFLDF